MLNMFNLDTFGSMKDQEDYTEDWDLTWWVLLPPEPSTFGVTPPPRRISTTVYLKSIVTLLLCMSYLQLQQVLCKMI